ncbi:hypothetical protein [Actinacidiphila glaucinigra]|uniref:hypothetical protein n=1 Tax=Actinacidiphila glaucinigra TaxID=235986 RepID=UPI003D8CCE62
MTAVQSMMDIKLAAADVPARVTFEPIGVVFEITTGDFITVRFDSALASSVEIYHWSNGISVWLPYPGESDYVVLDSSDQEMIQLW